MTALLPSGDLAFIAGVLVATICFTIAFLEWHENRSGLTAFALVVFAVLTLVFVWMLRLW